jgi:glyoxylase-like metal-dependent hydrolase (beta-lactamase superfamily II)
MSVREWAAMQRRGESRRLAAAIAPKVATFEPGRDILPGIRPVALYGHTPGHVAYEIASRGRTIEDIGDAAHSAIVSLAEPTWEGHIDEDPASGGSNQGAMAMSGRPPRQTRPAVCASLACRTVRG